MMIFKEKRITKIRQSIRQNPRIDSRMHVLEGLDFPYPPAKIELCTSRPILLPSCNAICLPVYRLKIDTHKTMKSDPKTFENSFYF